RRRREADLARARGPARDAHARGRGRADARRLRRRGHGRARDRAALGGRARRGEAADDARAGDRARGCGIGSRGGGGGRRGRGVAVNLTDLCLRRPVFAWMLMCGTILFGVVALGRIGVSQFPDVNNPTVTVSASWPGASPEDVETGLVNPIEDVLSQVTGVL